MNDAFGSAHRAHASTAGIVKHVTKAAAGLLLDKEIQYLTKVTKDPDRPCVAILGGAKVSDKIEVIQNLMKVVDRLLIGGAMAYTFLRARDEGTGKSLVEEDKIDLARGLMAQAAGKLALPVDHVVATELKPGVANQVVDHIPDGYMGLDIGPKSIERQLISPGLAQVFGMVRWGSLRCRRLIRVRSRWPRQWPKPMQ